MTSKLLIQQLYTERQLPRAKMQMLLTDAFNEASVRDELAALARQTAQSVFGAKIYIRGLIEFTNYCRNDCYYCGIRRSNTSAVRYHLSKAQILDCCRQGYGLGFRTFVLQGGEDLSYTDTAMAEIIASRVRHYPFCW